jgi:3-mercaptopropionate dioxygenase
MPDITRLRHFVQAMTRLAGENASEARWLAEGRDLLAALVAQDDWLPEECARPGPTYRQVLLHCDPLERFSVVCFVWGPGQVTPIHDHTVWGLVGMLRGEEIATGFSFDPAGEGRPMRAGRTDRLRPGEVVAVSPTLGDVHTVRNAIEDRPSISIHVYGANIGAVSRHVFDAATGRPERFVSGYTNAFVPNLWDRSAEMLAQAAAA